MKLLVVFALVAVAFAEEVKHQKAVHPAFYSGYTGHPLGYNSNHHAFNTPASTYPIGYSGYNHAGYNGAFPLLPYSGNQGGAFPLLTYSANQGGAFPLLPYATNHGVHTPFAGSSVVGSPAVHHLTKRAAEEDQKAEDAFLYTTYAGHPAHHGYNSQFYSGFNYPATIYNAPTAYNVPSAYNAHSAYNVYPGHYNTYNAFPFRGIY